VVGVLLSGGTIGEIYIIFIAVSINLAVAESAILYGKKTPGVNARTQTNTQQLNALRKTDAITFCFQTKNLM